MGKYVENWHVKCYPNGVIEVTFNVNSGNVFGWALHCETYGFDDEFDGDGVSEFVDIPTFLPKIDGIFVRSYYREKDQIVFVYHPVLREWYQDRQVKTILQGQ